jgi:hypothetical protein
LTCFLIAAQGQEPEEQVKTSFRVFPVLSGEWEGIFYQPKPEEGMEEIVFRARNRSFYSYDYTGPPQLSFYREDGLNEDGEMQYRIVAQTPVSGAELLIFFTQSREEGEGAMEFSTLSIDDGPAGLPADTVSFINMTPVAYACRFMDKDMVLQPGQNPPISVKEKLTEDIFIGLAISNRDTHRVVIKNRWRFHPGNRHLILLLPPRSHGSFRIRAYRISEFVGENKRFNPNWTPPEIIEDGNASSEMMR